MGGDCSGEEVSYALRTNMLPEYDSDVSHREFGLEPLQVDDDYAIRIPQVQFLSGPRWKTSMRLLAVWTCPEVARVCCLGFLERLHAFQHGHRLQTNRGWDLKGDAREDFEGAGPKVAFFAHDDRAG